MPEPESFPVRDVRARLDETVPKHWHGGRPGVSIFFDNLSLLFPEGERFFIRSVRRYADALTDPALRAAVRAFVGQEAQHTREHVRYNEMLRANGYPTAAIERRVARLLALGRRHLPPRMQLAATVALEHFTANLGHVLLADPRLLDGAHPEMATLWRWHAAEECEHKLVAHAVFEEVGGTYAERVAAMLLAGTLLWSVVALHQAEMMRADGIPDPVAEWRALLRFLFVEPGGMSEVARRTVRYFHPRFHPSEVDDAALLDAWKTAHAAAV